MQDGVDLGIQTAPETARLAPRRESFWARLGANGKKAVSNYIIVAVLVGLIGNFIGVKQVTQWVCAGVLYVIGWPDKPKLLEDLEEKAKDKIEEIKRKAAEKAMEEAEKARKAQEKARIALKAADDKAQDAIRAAKNAAREAAFERGVEAIKQAAPLVTTAVNDDIPDSGNYSYERMLVIARRIKFKIDRSWSKAKLMAEFEDALLKNWIKKGPNGRCPHCRKPMRVISHGTMAYLCSCGKTVDAVLVRAMGRPDMPRGFEGIE